MIAATARLAAFYRARETARADAVFRDPHAIRLAGESDPLITRALAGGKLDWYYTARTYAIDRLIARQVADGADLIVQLAAGLDARPYRLHLPPDLRWVEIDLPDIVEYKRELLADATPVCRVDRVDVDLSNGDARRGLFRDLGRSASRAVVVAEGLLVHLMAGDAGELSRDVAAVPAFRRWIADIVSTGLTAMLNEASGELVREAGAPYVFAPIEGPAFFRDDGWQVLAVRPLIQTAAKLVRLPVALRPMAMFLDSPSPGDRPWAAACLLGKEAISSGSPDDR